MSHPEESEKKNMLAIKHKYIESKKYTLFLLIQQNVCTYLKVEAGVKCRFTAIFDCCSEHYFLLVADNIASGSKIKVNIK